MVVGVLVLALLASAATADAQGAYDVLHTFSGVHAPLAPRHPILAADGNLYGASSDFAYYLSPNLLTRLSPSGQISILHALTAAEGRYHCVSAGARR
jgi:hypothetical protein